MRNDRQELQARFKELYPKKRLLAIQLNGFNHAVFFDNNDSRVKVERYSPYVEVAWQTPQSKALFEGYATYNYQGQPKEIVYVRKEDL